MSRYKKPLLLGLILSLCLASYLFIVKADLCSISSLKYNLIRLGGWAPLAFLALCIFRSFLLLPCGIFSVAGGILFGTLRGGLITLFGYTTNAILMYYLAGYLGRDWAQRLLRGRFDTIDGIVNKNSLFSIFLLRAVPILPFDAVSCIGGISKAKMKNFALATIFGSIPGVFVYTYFGSTLKSLSLQKIIFPMLLIILMSLVPVFYKLMKLIRKPVA